MTDYSTTCATNVFLPKLSFRQAAPVKAKKSVKFYPEVRVYLTHAKEDYDRRPEMPSNPRKRALEEADDESDSQPRKLVAVTGPDSQMHLMLGQQLLWTAAPAIAAA